MIFSLYKNLKLRLWHFFFMPRNVANVTSGKVELTKLVNRLSRQTDYYLVYQYGKSGSSTVYDFFNRIGLTAIHCHHLNDKTLLLRELFAVDPQMPKKVIGQRFFSNTRYRVYQRFLLNRNDKDVNIFISLREPEGFLKSVYFQQWRLFSELTQAKYGSLNEDKFIELFNESLQRIDDVLSDDIQQEQIEFLLFSEDLDFGTRCILHFIYGYVYWFELELFETFNINAADIHDQEGFWSFQKNNIKGCIVRVEDFNDSLNDSLKFLLDKDVDVQLVNKNVAQDKLNFEYYEHLKKNAIIPKRVSALMESSFSYRNFYIKK